MALWHLRLQKRLDTTPQVSDAVFQNLDSVASQFTQSHVSKILKLDISFQLNNLNNYSKGKYYDIYKQNNI
mgnify:CR=1 FL=1